MPTQRLYRPLLTRLYFKLGVLHEMQGLVDRSLLCYQEVPTMRLLRGMRLYVYARAIAFVFSLLARWEN